MWPITFRSIQTMSGTPSRTKPRTIRTLAVDSIRKGRSTRLLQLVQEAIELGLGDVLVVAVVDHQHRSGAAGAQALHGDVGEATVLGGLPVRDLELLLDPLLELLAAQERAGEIATHLDHVPADRLLVEHRVEGHHLPHRLRGQSQELPHLPLRFLAEPALVRLGDVERGDECRLVGLVDLLQRLDLLAGVRGEHGLSSPRSGTGRTASGNPSAAGAPAIRPESGSASDSGGLRTSPRTCRRPVSYT